MPNEERTVTDEVSGASDQDHPAGEGKSRVSDDLEKKVREQVKKEYERKEEENKALKDRLTKAESLLEELKNRDRRSSSDNKDIASLERMVERTAREIEENDTYPAWKKVIEKVNVGVLREYESLEADDLKDDLADRNNVEPSVFKKEIDAILAEGRWPNRREKARVRLAYLEWKKLKESETNKKKVEEKDKEAPQFQENARYRVPRKTNYGQEITSARKAGDSERVSELSIKRMNEIFDSKK